eukprot:7930699-Pyramimonas_sp.AAC.2
MQAEQTGIRHGTHVSSQHAANVKYQHYLIERGKAGHSHAEVTSVEEHLGDFTQPVLRNVLFVVCHFWRCFSETSPLVCVPRWLVSARVCILGFRNTINVSTQYKSVQACTSSQSVTRQHTLCPFANVSKRVMQF